MFLSRLRTPFTRHQLVSTFTISAQNHSNIQPLPPINEDLSRLLQGRISRLNLLQIHARIFRLNLHQNNLIATRLIGHYPPIKAVKVFRCLRNPNIFPFNAIIRVLAENGLLTEAFSMFKELRKSYMPNDLTFSFLFKACSRNGDGVVNYVRQVHCHVVKDGFVVEPFVCNGLVMVYALAVKDLCSARQVFDEMPERRNSVCWTSLISWYARVGFSEEALKLFVIMLKEDVRPESDTMVSLLSACSSIKNAVNIEKWVTLLMECKNGLLGSNLGGDYVNIVLVYLYGKLKETEKSKEAFDDVSDNGKRNVLSWNAMIGAYVQNGCVLEALSLFKSMLENHDCRPNHVTMVSALSACAEVGDLDLGIWIHEYMRMRGQIGVLSSNVNLATALIDMYSKCGSLEKAWEAFHQISKKDVVSFNAMIMALAINGKGNEALTLFRKMQELCLSPNSGTFLGALYACSHHGLLDKGREIFQEMKQENCVSPRLEHYACYIDILARRGYIDEALYVVNSMPFVPNNFVWGTLLSGCAIHNRLELAQSISLRLVEVDPANSGGYVMLSNSFASDHQWGDVSKLRGVMKEKGVSKQPGCSWINVNGVVHEFIAGFSSYDRIGSIHQIMELLLKEIRFVSQ